MFSVSISQAVLRIYIYHFLTVYLRLDSKCVSCNFFCEFGSPAPRLQHGPNSLAHSHLDDVALVMKVMGTRKEGQWDAKWEALGSLKPWRVAPGS